jgi:signal peptidase I
MKSTQKEAEADSAFRIMRLRWLALVSLLALAIPLAVTGLGYRMNYVVLSESMIPVLHPGDFVIANPMVSDVEVGDIVTFQSPLGGFLIHRVMEVVERDEAVFFVTKGDANAHVDSFLISEHYIIGKLFIVLPHVGSLFLIPRVILLVLNMGLVMAYVVLAFRLPSGDKNPVKKNQLRRTPKPIQVALILCVLSITFVAQSSIVLVYPSDTENITTTSPLIVLHEGTQGISTITDNINANVSVSSSGTGSKIEDYVDNNLSNVDSFDDKGTHSNFTAQQYGPDSTCDLLMEGKTLTGNYDEYIWISGNDDYVRKLNKSDPGGTEILNWETGTSYPFGCEFRIESFHEYLYIVDYGSGVDALIKFDANTGSELARWDISGYSGDAQGLTWNGSRWFIADRADDAIYQVDPTNPIVAERSFSYIGIGYITGLAWDGSYLWVTDEGSDTVYQIDIYGNIQTSWSLTNPTGIAYDPTSGHLWITTIDDYLYEYNTNGSEINSWNPAGASPEGVAFAHIDEYSYMLDLEVQWTNVDYDEAKEELAIYIEKWNNTHSLNATGGYMVVGDGTPDWGSTKGTISFWLNWDTFGYGATRPKLWGQHGNFQIEQIGIGTDPPVHHLFVDWGSTISIESNTNFELNKWYFIAVVWNEETDDLYLYVGDENNAPTEDKYNSGWTSSVSTVGVTENNFMSSSGGVLPMDGRGEDLRYWDIDRSLTEIQSDYNTELNGSETNLVSYFKLNNDFNDIGPNNDDGSGSGSYSFSSDVPFEPIPTENIRVDVRNGAAWQTVFNDLTEGWNNVSVFSYLTTSTFTIRYKGDTETGDTIQDGWNIDAALLHVWSEGGGSGDFNYVLNMTENNDSSWTVRLDAYDQSDIARLTNCTIYLYDGVNSTQIVILDGVYGLQTGPWYDLAALDTNYLWMHVEASGAGTSYIYTYLEILAPDSGLKMFYKITFEIV